MTATTHAPGRSAPSATDGAGVPRRLARVARQLVLGAVAAAAYYGLTRWLLDRFGSSGFLYALLALAAAMALLREFGPDLKALPGRVRERASRRPRDNQATQPSTAADARVAGQDPAPPTSPEPVTRAEAEAIFAEQRERLEQGSITQEAFDQFTRGFQVIDSQGKFWTIQPESGGWAYFKGGGWHQGLPLGTLTARRRRQE